MDRTIYSVFVQPLTIRSPIMYGWAGSILRVNLTTGIIKTEPLDETLKLNYLGGRGINSRILYDEVKAGIDPLGPGKQAYFRSHAINGYGAHPVGPDVTQRPSPP